MGNPQSTAGGDKGRIRESGDEGSRNRGRGLRDAAESLPLEGKGDREAVDEVELPKLRI